MKLQTTAGVLAALVLAFGLVDHDDRPAVAHVGTGQFHLELDLDTANGAGPCLPVDDAVMVARGAPFDVAICAGDTKAPPFVNHDVFALSFNIGYGPNLVAGNVPSDLGTDLDSNPDWNEGPTVGGTDWDCDVVSPPTGQPSPARIFCETLDQRPNVLSSESAHIATIQFVAMAGYEGALSFDSSTKLWTDVNTANEFGYAGCNVEAIEIPCTGGRVIICDGPPGPNTDNAWSNGPEIPGDDTTIPSGDDIPDNCGDLDKDNDGRPDSEELTGFNCDGQVTEVSTDTSYADGDGTSWDTDGDYLPDGGECDYDFDPTSPTIEQAAGERAFCMRVWGRPDSDIDSDGLINAPEHCKWMTSATNPDSDGDGLSDCEEVADVNGNGYVTTGDGILIQRATSGLSTRELATMDVNADRSVSAADALWVMQSYFGTTTCLINPKMPRSYLDPSGPRLEIDGNPANDGGPCVSIDSGTTVIPAAAFDVALCLMNATAPPLGGILDALQVEIAYDPSQVSASNVLGDSRADLNTNPDWQESAAGVPWDCNLFDVAASAPRASSTPLRIACRAAAAAVPFSAATVHLFTVHFSALTAVSPRLRWVSGTSELVTGDHILACGLNLTCVDAEGGTLPIAPPNTGTGRRERDQVWPGVVALLAGALIIVAGLGVAARARRVSTAQR